MYRKTDRHGEVCDILLRLRDGGSAGGAGAGGESARNAKWVAMTRRLATSSEKAGQPMRAAGFWREVAQASGDDSSAQLTAWVSAARCASLDGSLSDAARDVFVEAFEHVLSDGAGQDVSEAANAASTYVSVLVKELALARRTGEDGTAALRRLVGAAKRLHTLFPGSAGDTEARIAVIRCAGDDLSEEEQAIVVDTDSGDTVLAAASRASLGWQCLREGRALDALTQLRSCSSALPTCPWVLAGICDAECLVAQAAVDRASIVLAATRSLELGKAVTSTGNAADDVDAAAASDAVRTTAYIAMGGASLLLHDAESALGWFSRVSDGSLAASAAVGAAEALLALDRPREAIPQFEQAALRAEGGIIGTAASAGLAWARWVVAGRGDGEERTTAESSLLDAATALEDVEAASPTNWRGPNLRALTWLRLGKVYYAAGSGSEEQTDKAFSHRALLCAAKADPNLAEAFSLLGCWYSEVAKQEARAAQCFAKAASLDPGDELSGSRVADAHMRTGNLADAASACERAVAARPRALWAWWRLATLRRRMGKLSSAVSAYQRALRLQPNEAALWEGLADAYLEDGKLTAALKSAERAVELGPRRHKALCVLASAKARIWEFDESCQAWEAVLELRPNDAAALHGLGEVRLALARRHVGDGAVGAAASNLVQGVAAVSKCVELMPKSLCSWKLLGDLHVSAYYVSPATFAEEPAAALRARDPRALCAQSLVGYAEAAVGAYCHAVALAQGLADDEGGNKARSLAWGDLAVALYLRSRSERIRAGCASGLVRCSVARRVAEPLLDAAAKLFRRAVEADPLNPRLWNALGVTETRPLLAQHALIRCLELSSAVEGASGIAWANLAMLLLEAGLDELGRRALVAAQCADPSNGAVWIGHGIVNERAGGQDGVALAGAAYLTATELAPSPEALVALGFVELGLTRDNVASGAAQPGIAAAALRRAIAWDPRNPAALLAAAAAEEGLGLFAPACNDLENALALLKEMAASPLLRGSDDVGVALQKVSGNLGRVLVRLGRWQAALDALEEADPSHAGVQLCRSMALSALGKGEEARRYLPIHTAADCSDVKLCEPRLAAALGRYDDAVAAVRALAADLGSVTGLWRSAAAISRLIDDKELLRGAVSRLRELDHDGSETHDLLCLIVDPSDGASQRRAAAAGAHARPWEAASWSRLSAVTVRQADESGNGTLAFLALQAAAAAVSVAEAASSRYGSPAPFRAADSTEDNLAAQALRTAYRDVAVAMLASGAAAVACPTMGTTPSVGDADRAAAGAGETKDDVGRSAARHGLSDRLEKRTMRARFSRSAMKALHLQPWDQGAQRIAALCAMEEGLVGAAAADAADNSQTQRTAAAAQLLRSQADCDSALALYAGLASVTMAASDTDGGAVEGSSASAAALVEARAATAEGRHIEALDIIVAALDDTEGSQVAGTSRELWHEAAAVCFALGFEDAADHCNSAALSACPTPGAHAASSLRAAQAMREHNDIGSRRRGAKLADAVVRGIERGDVAPTVVAASTRLAALATKAAAHGACGNWKKAASTYSAAVLAADDVDRKQLEHRGGWSPQLWGGSGVAGIRERLGQLAASAELAK